ncbi:hypothetical protein HZC53_03290 [Candidatus Uhrbacteria bacterium]|nr:hypothetical protein [Candidatus Uhrbacteria bacterium]
MLDSLFDLHGLNVLSGLVDASAYPWEWLEALCVYISENCRGACELPSDGVRYDWSKGPIFISEGARVQTGAVVYGPAYIGPNCVIGHNALVRGGAMILDGCELGHCVEVKHSILLPGAHCGHRNYIGDTVIGRGVNFGDGSGTANLRADRNPKKTIKVTWDGQVVDTGLRKFGALVGDGSSIGCRATLNPGTILGKECLVLSNVSVSRTHPARSQFSNPEPKVTQRKS